MLKKNVIIKDYFHFGIYSIPFSLETSLRYVSIEFKDPVTLTYTWRSTMLMLQMPGGISDILPLTDWSPHIVGLHMRHNINSVLSQKCIISHAAGTCITGMKTSWNVNAFHINGPVVWRIHQSPVDSPKATWLYWLSTVFVSDSKPFP